MNYKALLLLALTFTACSPSGNNKAENTSGTKSAKGFHYESTIKHSDIFDIKLFEEYKQVVVLNPWKNDTMGNYILIQKGSPVPKNLPDCDFIIPVPIDEIACMSSTHIGFVDLLGEVEKVIGVSSGTSIYNEYLREKFEEGSLPQIGSHMSNNLEVIFDLSPELMMKTGFDNVRDEDTRIIEAGIPLVYNIEWMESNMLGRAEWLKYVSVFFNKEREADSIFNAIEKSYTDIVSIAQKADYKPSTLSGNNFKGTWYMPGGDSYIAKLILDAGGDYYYKEEPSKGSIPLSFEIVLDKQVDADFWFGVRANSLAELEMMDERYKLFKAFKNGNVYSTSGRINKYGANDYWESGVARPDLILKDVISIMHPEILPEHELIYYLKLEK